ncbi:hypothetical protein CONPUDRAFT_102575, partial [Coniophora puteana RWD-64-598 SS2]
MPTFTAMRRLAKEATIATWKCLWQAKLNREDGRFRIANRFPPTLKPRPHFIENDRDIYGRMLQIRTGHCFAGEYYASFVPSEPRSCPCGAPYQTRSHILEHCPINDHARHLLHEPGKDIALTDVLGTKKGLKGLAKFLKKTKAFRK